MFNLIHKLIVALLGKSKNINTMANNEQYPRFIPDKPTGDDVFEGQSQTNLANNICKYIRSNDSASSRERGQMPRIIGLEGKWGSGKSNVVENIKKHLNGEGYHTFTYDAWGHQEDLQRRSILETLTNDLIENKVLGGKVEIKDLAIYELPERSDIDNQQANAIDETSDAAIRLHQEDFPVLDFHVHLKDGFTADWAFAKSRKIGINYAIAPNCGRDFPLNTAKKAQDYLDNLPADFPFLSCMQAEGREWHILFGASIRKQFAYAFTDAMTFNDLNGKRTHIWRDNEVDCPIGSEEKYMDLIVNTICKLLAEEPADVYANPMRLPSILEKDAKKYWTPERRQKVLDALVDSGKALEINMITKLPDADFIKAAKERGVKFTFGSNNKDSNFGRFEYAYEIVRECNLTAKDIYNPKNK